MSVRPTTLSPEHGGSLEERVNDCYRALALIHAACQADCDPVFIGQSEVTHAVSMLAREAARSIEPLRRARFEIANWTPGAEKGGAR